MAILGVQMVITLVMVSLIQKLSPHFSLAKWLLCSTGLTRYLHPTDNELKTLAGVPKNKKKFDNGKGKGQEEKFNTFHVPRNLDLNLETVKISPLDVVHLRYYTEYQWLVDFSLYAAIVYILSEVISFFFPPKDEINLSMMWCLLVIFFAFKLLMSLTIQYFKSQDSIGERSTCIVTGFTYLLIAMVILIVDEKTLEIGLEEAYSSFNQTASQFLEDQGIASSGPASKIIVKFVIAVSCGFLGAIFTFPGLRMARMHWDSLKYFEGSRWVKILLNVSFALPFILVVMWIRPISRDYLTSRVFSGMDKPLITSDAFDTIRLILVIVAVVLRIGLMPIYLQSYLNLAYQRVEEQKKEAGRITNIELQQKISSIFYYLCVVTLQYVAPLLMCLYFALMYKTLGGYQWTSLFKSTIGQSVEECAVDDQMQNLPLSISSESGIIESAKTLQLSWQNVKNIFTIEVYRGVFGFATWWSCFLWFAASSLGMVYQSYFVKAH